MVSPRDFVKGLKAQGFKFKTVRIRKPSRAKLEREVDKYNSQLDSIAKKPEELVIPVEFRVLEARFYGFGERKITPTSEIRIGGRSPEYPIGDSYGCSFTGESLNDSSLGKINFLGWPAIEKDNLIRAYIFAFEEKGKKFIRDGCFGLEIDEFTREKREQQRHHVWTGMDPFILVPRELAYEESAVKIEKLNSNKEVVAVYESKKK